MGWIGVDLDGTLAHYGGWDNKQPNKIGAPIPSMLARVKKWVAEGKEVRIFTARMSHEGDRREEIRRAIERWCLDHIGQVLPITNVKDFMMEELWDDRCVQVETNTGVVLGKDPRSPPKRII